MASPLWTVTDDDIPAPRHQGGGGTHAELIDFIIDTQVFLDIGIRDRDVGFRLVVVVVGDEILHRIMREKRLELAVQLRSQRLVVAQDQGRTLEALDDIGHREGLPGSCHAEQRDGADPLGKGVAKAVDSRWLVAGRLIIGLELEFHGTKIHYLKR